MKTIETAIDTVNKFGDTSTIFKLDLKDDNEYVPLDDKKVVLNVANDTGLVLTTPMTTFSGHTVMVDFSSHGLAELTPDSYNLEIEVTYSDGDVSKFPTKGGLKFNITNNLKETTGALVPTVTFDNVLEAVDEKIAVYMDTVKVGPQGPKGEKGDGIVDQTADYTWTGKHTFNNKIIAPAGVQGNADTAGKAASADMLNTRTATFNDFADVAKNMNNYVGNWQIFSNKPINNGPYGTTSRSSYVTVNSAVWADAGLITFVDITGPKEYYIGIVETGAINWKKLSNDSMVVHNTGTETIAGDKNFIGQTTLKTGNYGLRVTTSGVQKTSDGGTTWTNI